VNAAGNAPPVAADDYATTDEDTPVNINVLANDSDTETGTPTNAGVVSGSGPSHGDVTMNAGGTFTYTPNTDFNGLDSFVYSVVDGNGGADTATGAYRNLLDISEWDGCCLLLLDCALFLCTEHLPLVSL